VSSVSLRFSPSDKNLMLRKFIAWFSIAILCFTTAACGSSTTSAVSTPNPVQSRLADGQYPVQQATYNDADGSYRLFLLNASPSVFTTTDLRMARLTEAETSAGQSSYLDIKSGQSSLHLSENFKIEYVHAVTENRTNPQTGRSEVVVVRQESSFWTPFAGALAGQMVANLLFTPQYYVPPVYQRGIMTGYGGYGSTYSQAVDRYQTRYQQPPPAVQNRTAQLRTTGNIRNSQNRGSTSTVRPSSNQDRPTGSGFGSSNLKPSQQARPSSKPKPSSGSFGSGRSSGASRRSFGGARRR